MKTDRLSFIVILLMAAAAHGQVSQLPTGHWQSSSSDTYTNLGLGDATFSLNIDVSPDGSFRGTWGKYYCHMDTAAYGVTVVRCGGGRGSNPVSGKFGTGNQGVIDLATLGSSNFKWSNTAGLLAIDLPQF